MILYVILIGLFILTVAAFACIGAQKKQLLDKLEKYETLLVKHSEYVAELSSRVDSVEDYVKMIKSETENDKHSDYWQSVMNYNPFIKKEGEK